MASLMFCIAYLGVFLKTNMARVFIISFDLNVILLLGKFMIFLCQGQVLNWHIGLVQSFNVF